MWTGGVAGSLPEGKVRYEVIVESRSRSQEAVLDRAVMPCAYLFLFHEASMVGVEKFCLRCYYIIKAHCHLPATAAI